MGKNKISHFFKVTFQKVFPCLAQSAPPPDLPTLHSVCWAQIKELENAAEKNCFAHTFVQNKNFLHDGNNAL